ncbi:phosphotransferase family protein [Variovorax sp. J22P168]|uniref:phosphotransferase family protein n=1 Tax=Variovorax jilinensis TaxID=3053513 RepID=UPI002577861C|nr:phosphotransferase family protein [Variovorax sp. J22P168]MDM0015144.1 phosphotransferase family protein [Variovorax sp. J22P168]
MHLHIVCSMIVHMHTTSGTPYGRAHRLAPLSVTQSDRDRPGPALIERMRSTFPAEREMDKMLTRKMTHRADPAYAGASLERMTEHLTAFLSNAVEGPFRIADQRWFAGGASKIQMGYTLHWNAPGRGASADRMVVRMEPSESVNSTSRAREFQLLKAFEGVVPVPHAFWVDAEAEWFPEPALLYSFCEGVTKPRATASGRLAGIGTNFGPELRQRLAPQFVRMLATIHTFDVGEADMSAFDVPPIGTTESALRQLNRARRIWEEDRGDDFPLAEVAANWLERNLPTLDAVGIVHGDYRSGNFLFDENSLEITAVLDWERGYLGDRHRDLAWTANHAFGHMAEDGKTFLASGLVPLDEFFESYEKLSGLSVDPARLRYYTIFNSYQLVVSALASAYRVVHLGKTHQDILLASAEPVGYLAAEQLRKTLEELL